MKTKSKVADLALVTPIERDDWRGRDRRSSKKLIFTAFVISIVVMFIGLEAPSMPVLAAATVIMSVCVLGITL